MRSWVHALTPASYSCNVDPAVAPWLNAVGIDQAKRLYYGLAYCPDCLHQGSGLKQWRLSFHTWCPLHERQLHDACDRCGAAFVPHLSRRSVAHCYRCGSTLCLARVDPNRCQQAAEQALQSQMDTWLLQACENDEEARDRLHCLRILVSVGAPSIPSGLETTERVRGPPGFRSTSRLEFLPLSERFKVMVWLSHLVANWPTSFRDLAIDVGLSQRSFARTGLQAMKSVWLTSEVDRLPEGSTRRRAPHFALTALPKTAQQGSPNWRATRAEMLMKKVTIRGN